MKERRPVKKTRIFLLVVIGTFLIFFIVNERSASASQSLMGRIFNPIRSFFVKSTDFIANIFSGFLNAKILKQENESLVFQNRALQSALSNYAGLKSENESLREALKIKSNQNFNFILADVISRSPLNLSQSFIINQGTEAGVKIGQAVVWAGQVLVGEIRNADKEASEARAINDSEFRAAVFVGDNNTEAVFRGNGLEPAQLDLVSTKANIGVGDRIITSGLDTKFPRGLYLGQIKSIKNLEGKVFQKVQVKPALDWSSLEEVLVIK